MPIYQSKIDKDSQVYKSNRADMLGLIEKLQNLNQRAAQLSAKKREQFHKRGQLLPRERLSRLLDPGMPFLEIANLSGYLQDTHVEEKSIPGATIHTGIGYIKGVRCVIVTDDSGIKAGALTVAGAYRIFRAQAISLEQNLPFVHLVESAGADLMNYDVAGFLEGGRLFANLARMSKKGIPVFAILHGSSTAGGAYMPGLSDYVVGVKEHGKAFLAGPPLLKAATGEIANAAELGGAEMHASVSGLVDYLAIDDADAILKMREIIGRLDWNGRCPNPQPSPVTPPRLNADDIAGLVPINYRTPYDVCEVIARIVDGSDFSDFKSNYGRSMICAQAQIQGFKCGILSNNGPIDTEGATKAAQFIQLMDQADTPLIFLQNTTGYMVGKDYEQAGMIKHGSKMIQAMTNADVPRITLMIGASYGAGNYGMCGRGFDPDFLFTWPNAATGVMGGEQAATVMNIIAEAQAHRMGQTRDLEQAEKQSQILTQLFDGQSSAFYTSGHGLDDGMIDPRDTRLVLGFLLSTVWEARHRNLKPNSFGVARM